MSFAESIILRKVCDLHRLTGGPVRTLIVADMVGKYDRTVRLWLVKLERRGLVQRVGQRGGWLPVRA